MLRSSFIYTKILWLQFHTHKEAFQLKQSNFQTQVRIKSVVYDFSSSELAGV